MIAMNEAGAIPGAMLTPFDALYEQPKPRFIFKMPRVVPDQKHMFENDDLFRQLSRESEVRYTGYRERPQEERQARFHNGVREGHTEIAFVASGTNIQLIFNAPSNGYHPHHHHHQHLHHQAHLSSGLGGMSREIDFDKEHGKVHLKSRFIMNGVCVCWRGWIDLERLDGVGCLEFDEERATMEDSLLRDQINRYNQRLREYEERQRSYRGAISTHSDRHVDVSNTAGSGGSVAGGSLGQSMDMFNNG